MARGKSIASLLGNTSAVCGEDFLRKSCYTFLGRHIKPDQTKIGKFIATLRKEKGLTQEKLGEKLGEEQVDAIVSDAVDLCNGLCEEYKGLSEKKKVHTERMIFLFTGIKPEGCDGGRGGLRETFFRRRFPPASPKVRRPPSKNSLKGYGSNALSRGILPTAKLWCLFEKAPQKSASSLLSELLKNPPEFQTLRAEILPETRDLTV